MPRSIGEILPEPPREPASSNRFSRPPAIASKSQQNPLLVLGKITAILDAFSPARPSMTLGEIQHATRLPMSTVQRLVSNLLATEILERTDTQIRLGVKISIWATAATKRHDILAVVTPILAEVREITGESVSFFRVERGFRVCVALAETKHALRHHLYVGMAIPLRAGAVSQVLLAWNPELAERVLAGPAEEHTQCTGSDTPVRRELIARVKTAGYAASAGDLREGASELAAPVFSSSADLIGALAVSGPALRITSEQCRNWADLLLNSAERITRTMGGRVPTQVRDSAGKA
jgi:DNA-binding IclR family transcriptional regulator